MPKIKTVRGIEKRKVVSQKEWLVVRKKPLVKEKKFSKAKGRDENPNSPQDWVRYHDEYKPTE